MVLPLLLAYICPPSPSPSTLSKNMLSSFFSFSFFFFIFITAVEAHLEGRTEETPPLFPKRAWPTESGYLAVDENSSARMFYAFYEALRPGEAPASEPVPIIVWLQGGPGCSGMIGNFYELGPWRVAEDGCLHPNPAPWNDASALLFLDNPVGTGFSIAPDSRDIPSDQDQVARHLYNALQNFFSSHPDSFRSRPFYVTGESYAGKYAPSLGAYILKEQDIYYNNNAWLWKLQMKSSVPPLRLDGVAIGNGLTHPIAQVLLHAPTAYYMGLIDEEERESVDKRAKKVVELIEDENWSDSHNARSELLQYLQNITGLATLYDIRRTKEYYSTQDGVDYLTPFLNSEEVWRVLRVETEVAWESCNSEVGEKMGDDVMKSTKPLVEALVHRVPVLLYQGQFDLQDGVASNEAWIRVLDWSGLPGFLASKKKVWSVDGVVAGYVRSYANLTHVVVLNAGHFVPTDQDRHSQRMIHDWILGTIYR